MRYKLSVLLLLSYLQFGCWQEKLELKDNFANVEKALVSLDSLLAKLPYDDPNYGGFRYCGFDNGKLTTICQRSTNCFDESVLNLQAVQQSAHFVTLSNKEHQQLYFLMKFLIDNYITVAVERKGVWYHYYKTSEAVESPHERQVVVYRSGEDTSNFYKQYEVVAKEGNLLLLASIPHPDL